MSRWRRWGAADRPDGHHGGPSRGVRRNRAGAERAYARAGRSGGWQPTRWPTKATIFCWCDWLASIAAAQSGEATPPKQSHHLSLSAAEREIADGDVIPAPIEDGIQDISR